MMAESIFRINTYTIAGQYLREYTRATLVESESPVIEIKRYTPWKNLRPKTGDVTIVAAGGIGFIKELYEPLFEDLVTINTGYRVRGIWIADMTVTGASAVANKHNLGNDPHWFDHSRDLLLMINHFQQEMPRPLVGLGHSMGGAQICYLSLLHPSLFTTLILLEPSIYQTLDVASFLYGCRSVARRRELWSSRQVAEEAIRNNRFYQRWDNRVIDRLLTYQFDKSFPGNPRSPQDLAEQSLSITTPKHMELALMARPNFSAVGKKGLDEVTLEDRTEVPDIDPTVPTFYPVYRAEPNIVYRQLENIRPSVLYIVGDESPPAAPKIRAERLKRTGSGVGGSGGVRLGMVKEVLISGGQHTIPLDKHLPEAVRAMVPWLTTQLARWEETDRKTRAKWDMLSTEEKQRIDEKLYLSYKQWDDNTDTSFDDFMKSKI